MCTSERFLGVFLSFLVVTYSFGKAVRTEFDWEPPLKGYFGCKFNRELCTSHEICIDDDLFGNCQRRTLDKFDLHRYDLDIDTLERLEQSLRQLIGSKYSWANSYTQCIVGGTLFAFRENIEFNPRTCKQIINEQTNEIITEQVLKLLGDYTDEVTNVSPGEREDGQLQPNNDFVTIHKYYKPKKSDTTYSNYQPPSDSGVGNVESQEYLKFLRSLNPEELNILQSYLALDDSVQTQNELLPTDDQPMYESPSQRQPWPATSEWTNTNGGDETDLPSDVLSRRETQLLLNLLNGDLSVDGLSDEDVERLSSYVTTLLDKPQEETKTAGYTPDEMIEDVSKPDQLRQADTQQQQRFTEQNMENLSKPVDTRDPLGDIVVKGPLHPDVKPNPIWATPSVTELTKEQPNDALLTNLAAQKKAAPPSHDVIETDKQTNKQATIRGTTEPVTSKYSLVENDYVYITFRTSIGGIQAQSVVKGFEKLLGLNKGAFSIPRVDNDTVIFQVVINNEAMNASEVAALAYVHKEELEKIARTSMSEAGIGNVHRLLVDPRDSSPPKYFVLTFVLCGCVAGVLIAVVALYLVRRHSRTKQKLAQLASSADPKEASQDYQDLCRQRMQSKAQEKPEPLHIASRIGSSSEVAQSPRSSKSSTSSWSEEPVTTNMDISTGHVVLSYMEDHLKDRDRLDREWEALCAYEAEPSSCDVASSTNNARKNRYTDVLPYDHSRVVLNVNTNVSSCDYMNASSITDHDPRNPAYVATQGPLPHTVADFWQMIWEQGSVVIVMLTRLTENGMAMCHRYWPEEGSDLYHIYEVHLVSEHIWCDDFLVRSFYLKNLQTNETRTVTQFHYLTWPEGGIPATAKALLDFRRKVNKSYRGRSCPVIVHCNDGVGRTGTYILIDMVLNRMYKGAKEIDIAATLEHIRDQRISMLQTKDQFEFSLAAVAEEVHAVLKALPQ